MDLNWIDVAQIKCGKEIRLIVSLECPSCKACVPATWQGVLNGVVYPTFDVTERCPDCDCDTAGLAPPVKSVLRWMYLARIEVHKQFAEEQRKPIVYRSQRAGKRSRKRVKTAQAVNAAAYLHYMRLSRAG